MDCFFASTVRSVVTQDDEFEAPAGTGVVLVAGTKGHVVFGRAADTFALWTVAPSGQRTGAWVEHINLGRDRAAQLLTVVERRVIAGIDRSADLDVLRLLADAADVEVPDSLADCWLDLFDAADEIQQVRQQLTEAQPSKTKPPEYRFQLTDLPRIVDAALQQLQVVAPRGGGGQAADQALAQCYLLGALVEAWQETERARLRRKALHHLGGPTPRPLPERWLARLTQAGPIRIDV